MLVPLFSGVRSCVASNFTALLRSSLITLLIPPLHIGRIVAQQKSIGRLMIVCIFSLHRALPMDVYKTWLKW